MKSTFRFLYFVIIFLFAACWIVSVHAASESSSCTSYYTAYQSAIEIYNAALEAAQRAEVAYLEAIPGSYPIPSNLQHLQEEYESDPEGFIKKWKECAVEPCRRCVYFADSPSFSRAHSLR